MDVISDSGINSFCRVLGQKPEFNWVEKRMGGTYARALAVNRETEQ